MISCDAANTRGRDYPSLGGCQMDWLIDGMKAGV